MLSTHVQGIPCLVDPVRVRRYPGSFSYNAASDLDYYGYDEVEFDVYDRRGRAAPWLEVKMTRDDVERIEGEILEAYEKQRQLDQYD
jgi:hypothetical protein